ARQPGADDERQKEHHPEAIDGEAFLKSRDLDAEENLLHRSVATLDKKADAASDAVPDITIVNQRGVYNRKHGRRKGDFGLCRIEPTIHLELSLFESSPFGIGGPKLHGVHDLGAQNSLFWRGLSKELARRVAPSTRLNRRLDMVVICGVRHAVWHVPLLIFAERHGLIAVILTIYQDRKRTILLGRCKGNRRFVSGRGQNLIQNNGLRLVGKLHLDGLRLIRRSEVTSIIA